MASQEELVQELRIDRDESGGISRPILIFTLIAVIGGISLVLAYLYWTREVPPRVESILARPAASKTVDESVLDATGYVVARRSATVSSRTAGRVASVLVEEGMEVEENQLLATLDDEIALAQLRVASAQLEGQKSAIAELVSQLKQAERTATRAVRLRAEGLISDEAVEEGILTVEQLEIGLERAEKNVTLSERQVELQRAYLKDFEIRAPFAGVVTAKAAQPGEMVAPVAGGGFTRTGICTIVDMDSLEVQIDVNEAFINRVSPGQQTTVQLTAYPEVRMPAEVIAIIPTADRSRATVRVRVGFSQRDNRVLPDMAVKVAFLEEGEQAQLEEVPQGVLIPVSAVDTRTSKPSVWVIKDDVISKRDVVTVDHNTSEVRVESGLRAGERVLVNVGGGFETPLRDGLRVDVGS